MDRSPVDPDDDTPPERPAAVLEEHRGYVQALSDAAMQLSAAVQVLGDVIHELRVARDPIAYGTRQKLGRFGLAVRDVGQSVADAFMPDGVKDAG